MSIRLNWISPAQPGDEVIIYRSSDVILDNALPSPFASLAGNATEYVDDTNLLNVKYHYRVGFRKGTDVALSPNRVLAEYAELGIGPQTLRRGDYNVGYFGQCTPAELFDTVLLGSEVGMNVSNVLNAQPVWNKFIHDGKIKYIPNRVLSYSTISHDAMYSLGLVYGRNDNGDPGAIAPVNQNKIVSRNGYSYRVKLLSTLDPGVDRSAGTTIQSMASAGKNSEVQQLFLRSLALGRLAYCGAPRQSLPNFLGIKRADMFGSTNIMIAGRYSDGSVSRLDYNGAELIQKLASNSAAASGGWLPVLELITP